MKQKRPSIPKATQELVLEEYQHRCAIPICNVAKPQLHHIDLDNTNNDPLNLIPLCPTHHLLGQHGTQPTFTPTLLKFYRIHKHSLILHPRFMSIFKRLEFLENVSSKSNATEVRKSMGDLIKFIRSQGNGDYYASTIGRLTAYEPFIASVSIPYGGSLPQWYINGMNNEIPQYLEKIQKNRDEVVKLIIEFLDFQNWPSLNF